VGVRGQLHAPAASPWGRNPDTQLGGLDILKKRKISCPYWDLKPGLSSL